MIDWLRRGTRDPEIVLSGRKYPIVVIRRANAKRLTLRLAGDGSHIRISTPTWCPTREAVTFVHARADWLEQQLAGLGERPEVTTGSAVPFRGRNIVLDWRADAPRRPHLYGSRLVFGGERSAIPKRAEQWLRSEALGLLRTDLAEYSLKIDRPAPDLRLSRAQRRWGSCASNGTVRINWRLIMAPDFVRRSVVAHETAHLVHFDHSSAFHQLLAQIYDSNLAAAESWLKSNGRSLYGYFG